MEETTVKPSIPGQKDMQTAVSVKVSFKSFWLLVCLLIISKTGTGAELCNEDICCLVCPAGSVEVLGRCFKWETPEKTCKY